MLAGGPVREVLLSGDGRVQVRPFTFEQLPALLALGDQFAVAIQQAAPAAAPHRLYVLLAAAPAAMRQLIALGAGLAEEAVRALPILDAVQILDAILEVNADFFGLALGLLLATAPTDLTTDAAGPTWSSDSSAPGTPSTPSAATPSAN